MQFIKNKTSQKSKLLLTGSVLMLNGNMCEQSHVIPRSGQYLKQYAAKIPAIDTSKKESMGIDQMLNKAKGAYEALKYYLQELQEVLPKDEVPSTKHLKDSLDTLKYYLQKVEQGLLKDNISSKKNIQELYNTLKDCSQKAGKALSKDNVSSREDLTALYNTITDRLQKEQETLSKDNDEGYESNSEEDNEGYEIGYKVQPIYEEINYGVINRSKDKKQEYSNDTKEQGYNSGSNTTDHIYKDLKDDGQKSDNDNDNNGHIYEIIASTAINGCKNGKESNDLQDQSNVCKKKREATKPIQIMKDLKVDLSIVYQRVRDLKSCYLIDKVQQIERVINEIVAFRRGSDNLLTDKQKEMLRGFKLLINGLDSPCYKLIELYNRIGNDKAVSPTSRAQYSKTGKYYEKELDELLRNINELRSSILVTDL